MHFRTFCSCFFLTGTDTNLDQKEYKNRGRSIHCTCRCFGSHKHTHTKRQTEFWLFGRCRISIIDHFCDSSTIGASVKTMHGGDSLARMQSPMYLFAYIFEFQPISCMLLWPRLFLFALTFFHLPFSVALGFACSLFLALFQCYGEHTYFLSLWFVVDFAVGLS